MKLTVSKNASAMKDSGGGGGYINTSGIYDVTINYVQVADTKNKAKQLNFNVTHSGMDQTIYGPILLGKDGKVNEITQNLLNRLCIIAGMEDGQEIETESAEYAVGKDRKMMEMDVIPDLAELSVKMRIQMEYNLWDDNIQERKGIRAFYREDGATAAEAESGENIGKRLALDEDKYASNVTYKDGLTEADIAAWIKARIDASSAAVAPTPVVKATAKRPLFASK
jgi:hypothetical protein